jgi:hypothetical protein
MSTQSTPNPYETRRANRAQRLELAAQKAEALADATYNRWQVRAAAIPLGQPILIGHHSEKRDRNYRERNDAMLRRSFELRKRAQELRWNAAGMSAAGISSDDPDAIKLLKEELAETVKKHEANKARNKAWRAKDRVAALGKLGYTPEQVETLGAKGLVTPDYRIALDNAKIKRLEKRIKSLANRDALAEKLIEETGNPIREVAGGEGWKVWDDLGENRTRVKFDRRLTRDEVKVMRAAGFLWAPSASAWQRKFSAWTGALGKNAAEQIARGATNAG